MGRAISALFVGVVLSLVLAAGAFAFAPRKTDEFGGEGPSRTDLMKPGGIAVDQTSGDVFVADTDNNRIDAFNFEGDFIRAWGWGVVDGSEELQVCTRETACQAGLAGSEEGEMDEVISVAVSPRNGDVYTVDRGDGRIQQFNQGGKFIREFGGYETFDFENPGPHYELFEFPLAYGSDIAIGSAGEVYVSDAYRTTTRVAVFSPTGTYERSVKDTSGPGQLYNAASIAVDSARNLYVVDPFAQRVVVFNAAGKYVRKEAVGLESHGIAIDPRDNHSFVEASKGEDDYTIYEYDANGKLVEETPVPDLSDSREGFVSFGLAFSAVAAFPGRAVGALYATDLNASTALVLTAPQPGAPIVTRTGATGIGSGGADLNGTVNPDSAETTYVFEYGTTTAYGSKSPPFGFSVGAGDAPVEVGTHIAGLAANTVYHYRLVATNALGTTAGPDRTFATTAPGAAVSTLPDERAYELVSPVEKNLNDIAESVGLSSSDGDAVAFSSLNGLPTAEGGGLLGAYVAERDVDGWTTYPASPPDTNRPGLLTGVPLIFSRDLSQEVVKSNDNVTGTAPASESGNLFLHTNVPSAYQLITGHAPKEEGTAVFNAVGASADFSRIFFQANAALTPDAPENAGAFTQLYEWSDGSLKLAGVAPDGEPIANGAQAEPSYEIPKTGVVSEDGSRLFFTSPTDFSVPAQLYERVDGNETIELSETERTEPDTYEPKTGVTFQGASADGSSAFFTSNVELTDDADTGTVVNGEFIGPDDAGANLYRSSGGKLADLTVDLEEDTHAGADVRGVLLAPGGGSAYFGATGVLAAGATAGAPNLYRWTAGGGVQFIATIAESDPFMQAGANVQTTARTTADGSVLVFTSRAFIGGAEEVDAQGNPVPEIYRYVPGNPITCVSCAGDGTPASGAVLTQPQFPGAGANVLSTDGSRVFFETHDALVPADTNGTGDVYEWEAGAPHLISSGTGSANSNLLDASPSGNDVFFTTRTRLVASDSDENVDVYDARVDGGFPEPATPAPPCSGEACRPPTATAPAAPGLASGTQKSRGNLRPNHHHKKKHRKVRRCKRKHKRGKTKCPTHRRRHPNGKRG